MLCKLEVTLLLQGIEMLFLSFVALRSQKGISAITFHSDFVYLVDVKVLRSPQM